MRAHPVLRTVFPHLPCRIRVILKKVLMKFQSPAQNFRRKVFVVLHPHRVLNCFLQKINLHHQLRVQMTIHPDLIPHSEMLNHLAQGNPSAMRTTRNSLLCRHENVQCIPQSLMKSTGNVPLGLAFMPILPDLLMQLRHDPIPLKGSILPGSTHRKSSRDEIPLTAKNHQSRDQVVRDDGLEPPTYSV